MMIVEDIRSIVRDEMDKYFKEKKDEKTVDDDEIFLLSSEEYNKYKSNIPLINAWWWLRSPDNSSDYSDLVAFVCEDGSAFNYGSRVSRSNGTVRPAIRLTNHEPLGVGAKYRDCVYHVGDRFIKYNFPWIVIDDNLAIAEVPIAFRRFDKESTDYGHSEIRRFLLDWKENRECVVR